MVQPVRRPTQPLAALSVPSFTVIILVVIAALLLVRLAMAGRIVKQYEQGVLFRLGMVQGDC